MVRVSDILVHTTIDGDVTYYLECPLVMHHTMRITSHMNVTELTAFIEQHDTGFKICGLCESEGIVDFFRIPHVVIDALRAQKIKCFIPYVRDGMKHVKVKTGPEDAVFVCDSVVTI